MILGLKQDPVFYSPDPQAWKKLSTISFARDLGEEKESQSEKDADDALISDSQVPTYRT